MTAIHGTSTTPKERLLNELLSTAARLNLEDLTWLTQQAQNLWAQRLETEAALHHAPPNADSDPHGA